MYSAATHYAVEPLEKESTALTDVEARHILGGEAAEWSEYATAENLDGRIWPRMGAIAERLWSPREVRDVASMYRRLDAFSRDLEWRGLLHRENPRLMLQRLAGDGPISPLRTLASAVEPVKGYKREETNRYMQQTPLNRLVDAVPPESDAAREFSTLAARAKADPVARATLRRRLMEWRDNDTQLHPQLEQSFLLTELIPVSQNLAQITGVGLKALSAIETRHGWSTRMRKYQSEIIDDAAKPRAELLIAIAPGVRALVEAAGGRK